MELVLVTQLLHSGQQVMDDSLEFRAVQLLQYQDTPCKLISFTFSRQLERSYLTTYHLPYTHTIPDACLCALSLSLSLSYTPTRPSEREVEIIVMTHFLLQEPLLSKPEVRILQLQTLACLSQVTAFHPLACPLFISSPRLN